MGRIKLNAGRRPVALLAMAALLGAGLPACQSPEQRRYQNLAQDTGTCTDFGARQGSREYTDCMLAQQSRRDNKALNALEQQRLSAQISKDNLETVRRLECDREAKKDREAGRRPRRCD